MRKVKNSLCFLLFVSMCVCTILAFKSAPKSINATTTQLFTDSFDYKDFQPNITNPYLWTKGDYERPNGDAPTIESGVVKFATKQTVQFNWKKLISYSTSITYTFEFDFKVTNSGNGTIWSSEDCTRAIYVAFGGYYNQIEIPMKDGRIRAGDTYQTASESVYLNKNLHAKLVLVGSTCTTTVTEGGTVVISGSRTNSVYSTSDAHMPYLAIRCEDGAVTVDNFSFTDGTTFYAENFSSVPKQGDITSISLWTKGDYERPNSTAPATEGGVVKYISKRTMEFNWQKMTAYSSAKTYTFEFDFKVTNTGDGSIWGHADCTRALYVAFGGYYNQIEIPNKEGKIRAGDTYQTAAESVYLNKNLHAKIVLVGTTCTTTITDGGTVVITGSRTNSVYTSDAHMPTLAIRCEDGAVTVDNFSFNDGTYSYSENFSTPLTDDYMSYSGKWTKADHSKTDAEAPTVDDGVVKFVSRQSMEFNWKTLVDYATDKIFVFEFDFKITSAGDGSYWGTETYTRALYVAFGGWYNQIEIPTQDGRIRAGDTYQTVAESVYLNKNLHAKILLEGKTVTTAIYDSSNKIIISGNRTNDAYASSTDEYMPYFSIRCEDGAFQIDNFEFYTDKADSISSTTLNISSGKYAKYTAKVNYTATKKIYIKLNSTELMTLSPEGGLTIGGSGVLGTFPSGDYTLNIMVNVEQTMVIVELTPPGGGVLRRGSYIMLPSASSYKINVYGFTTGIIKSSSVSYGNITKNNYQINETEPSATGFASNVYNIVTSFDDATSTRNFAFTAKTSYVNGAVMAVKYRVKGTSAWTKVNAVKETESINTVEDYYKADVTGLTAGTEYEYKVGKSSSTDETNDWSKTYTFTTATGREKEFSFFAVGDTQGVTWNGKVEATKGFMYAQTAIQEAMEEVVNPAFILHTGDYVEGQRSELQDQWNLFFKALGDYGATYPMFGTIGNHDTYQINTDTGDNYFDLHFNHPNNGGAAALDSTYTSQLTSTYLKALIKKIDESIYSFNYGDAHIVVLASGNYSSEDRLLLEAQRKWLEADLQANECARWKIIMVHEAVYHRIGGTESRPWLHDVIEQYGVDLLIQGHSHVVTRTYPMKNGNIVTKSNVDKITKGSGTVYTTIGSTAYNHDGLGNPNVEEMAVIVTSTSTQPTFATISVTNNKLVMTVKQIDGCVLDSFEITASSTDTTSHTGTLTLQGAKSATCTQAGYTGDKVCSDCGKVAEYGTVIPATGHSFTKQTATSTYLKSAANCKSAAVYYKCCATCGLSSKGQTGEATFTSGSVNPNNHASSTTVNGGTQGVHTKYSCCGATASTTHSYTNSITLAPTCIATGTKTYTCGCGYSYTETLAIDSTNHANKTPVYGGTQGVHTKYSCCGATASSTHTFGDLIDCGSDHKHTCACGYEEHLSHVHDHESEHVATNPSCTANQTNYYVCACGSVGTNTYEVPNTKTAHNFTAQVPSSEYLKSEATCNSKAVYYTCCSDCGLSSKGLAQESTFEYGEYADHDYGEWIEEVPAEIGKAGTKGHYCCAECGEYFDIDHNPITDLTIPPLPDESSESSSESDSQDISQESDTSVSDSESQSDESISQESDTTVSDSESQSEESISQESQTTISDNESSSQIDESVSQDSEITVSDSETQSEESETASLSDSQASNTSSAPQTSVSESSQRKRGGGCSGDISGSLFALPLVAIALLALKRKEN